MFFKECDDYVDGGVLANNPSETGLTAIQNFHHSKGSVPISLVVRTSAHVYIHSNVYTCSYVIYVLCGDNIFG